jgi:hypothetical protein
MNKEPSQFDEDNPPSFGALLALVATGDAKGFTIFGADGGIGYAIFEPGEDIDAPGAGETWVPMPAQDAGEMIACLQAEAPEELLELGRLAINPSQNLN